MTSLTETLPILDDAVPALPVKVEAVGRKSDEFHEAARQALAVLRGRRDEAEALVEQVRQALDALRDQVAEQRQQVAQHADELRHSVEEEARDVEKGADEVVTAGQEAAAAFDQLEGDLVQAGDRTASAHADAREAMTALAAEATSGEQELQGASDAMSAAVSAAQQTIADGQQLVSQAVARIKDTMQKLLADAQERLEQTYRQLDEVRDGQERAVTEATATLDAERRRLQQELELRVDQEVREAITPELEAGATALEEMGQQVLALQSEAERERGELADQLTDVAERIPRLQDGAGNVKRAADQVGIAWP